GFVLRVEVISSPRVEYQCTLNRKRVGKLLRDESVHTITKFPSPSVCVQSVSSERPVGPITVALTITRRTGKIQWGPCSPSLAGSNLMQAEVGGFVTRASSTTTRP